MQTNDVVEDPNSPSENQLKLKRVETQVRRRGNCEFLMELDTMAMLSDRRQTIQAIQTLIKKLND